MPGSPGHPILTEAWHFGLLAVAGVAVVWILTRIARRIADKSRDRDRP
jgi:hypothetical protein